MNIINKISNRKYKKLAKKIRSRAAALEDLTDDEVLRGAVRLRDKARSGLKPGDLRIDVYALVLEAFRRNKGVVLRDSQICTALALDEGRAVDLPTGEGKTYAAVPALVLNAFYGSVFLVTANEYLALRDLHNLHGIYKMLGLSCGANVPSVPRELKKDIYSCDIVYGIASELTFDYLKQQLVYDENERYFANYHFVVVDEIDAVLLDEASLPSVITSPEPVNEDLAKKALDVADRMCSCNDYEIDRETKGIFLTDQGIEHAEHLLRNARALEPGGHLYDGENTDILSYLLAALKAKELYKNGVQYVVQEGDVVLVDEISGRLLPGRILGEGVHQAIAVKEGFTPKPFNRPLAEITYPKFFAQFSKISGMSGTADAASFELSALYGLETVVIEPETPCVRKEYPDLIFRTKSEKYDAVVEETARMVKAGRPVLIGVDTIDAAQALSALMNKAEIPHKTLTAQQHAKEAEYIAQAGSPGCVTVVANLAGRGTDIKLGGHVGVLLSKLPEHERESALEGVRNQIAKAREAVLSAGGLHVIGVQRGPSRRVDMQLKGRSGRQGEPGSSRFYVSLEDELIRAHTPEKIESIMNALGAEEGDALEHPFAAKIVDAAQMNRETLDFERRKTQLAYDSILDNYRRLVYEMRDRILVSEAGTLAVFIQESISAGVQQFATTYLKEQLADKGELSMKEAQDYARQYFHLDLDLDGPQTIMSWETASQVAEQIGTKAGWGFSSKLLDAGVDLFHPKLKKALLLFLDTRWSLLLEEYGALRNGIHLVAYSGKNPAQALGFRMHELFETVFLDGFYKNLVGFFGEIHFDAESGDLIPEKRTSGDYTVSQPRELSERHA